MGLRLESHVFEFVVKIYYKYTIFLPSKYEGVLPSLLLVLFGLPFQHRKLLRAGKKTATAAGNNT